MAEFFILGTIFVALAAYLLTGGADFGAGIVETFAPKSERRRIRELAEHAIAPIWEANHIWIILALVLVFVAYPRLYAQISITLHLPLLLMLAGIVLRGTAFTFRYYDVGGDPTSSRLWTLLFRAGSFATPLIFGMLAAALVRGQLPNADAIRAGSAPGSAYALYVAPWVGAFPIATGLFVVCVVAWVAALFLLGELSEPERQAWTARVRRWELLTVMAGALVSVSAGLEGVPIFSRALGSPVVLAALVVATATALWLSRPATLVQIWPARVLTAVVVVAFLIGFLAPAYPDALFLGDGTTLGWHESRAPDEVFRALASTVVVALALVLPGLVYLFRIFKARPPQAS